MLYAPFELVLISILVNNTDFTLSKFRFLIFTKSKLLSLFSYFIVQVFLSCCAPCTALLPYCDLWPCLCLLVLLLTTLKWVIFPHLLDFLPYARHSLWVPCTTILEICYQFLLIYIVCVLPTMVLFCLSLLIESDSFMSLILPNTAFSTLCSSTL